MRSSSIALLPEEDVLDDPDDDDESDPLTPGDLWFRRTLRRQEGWRGHRILLAGQARGAWPSH